MAHIVNSSLFLFFCFLFFISCEKVDSSSILEKDDGGNGQDTEQKEEQKPFGEVYQPVIGKWSIYLQCGGVVGCDDTKDFFYEFTPTYRRVYNNKAEENESVIEDEIIEWEKTDEGCRITIEASGEQYVYSLALKNDTLHIISDMFSWYAVRVQNPIRD